jgi:hypothetical protein
VPAAALPSPPAVAGANFSSKHQENIMSVKKPLRDWKVDSYKQDGRAVSSLDNDEAERQIPAMPAGFGKDAQRKGGSGDPGRRNK